MARNRSKKAQSARRPIDLEAVGLVLLAAGASLLGLLLPQLPTGELGALVQRAVTGRIGYAAYAVPVPLLVLGVAFLLRRNPPGWPRVLTGYLLSLVGLWGLATAIVPAWAGTWGVAARAAVTGPAGAALAVPALLLVTFGIEAMAGWTPTRIVRATVRGLARATRRTWRAAAAGRRAVKARAAFRADVALVRGEVVRVAKDLDALAGLYPGSGPLARWREQVEELRGRLRKADADGLAEARADVAAWREAVDDYTAARAAEMVDAVRAEEVRDFAPWRDARAEDLAEPVAGTTRAARALDGVRKALALDLTALDTRYRKLTRARDQAAATLPEVDAAGLVTASHAHAERRAAYKEVAAAAEEIEADAERLEAWRELAAGVGRTAAELGEVDEVQEFDEALARDLRERGRTVLTQLEPWSEARVAVERRAREAAEEAARRAREEALADDAPEGAEGSADDTELLGPGDVPAEFDDSWGAAAQQGHDAPDAAGDERDAPPFEPTHRAGGGSRSPATPSATRDAGDVPEVGGIEIQIPPVDLLDPVAQRGEDPRAHRREVEARVRTIDETLANFKLQGRVVSSVRGPTVTRFEVEPAPGEKIARFATLADDLARAMAASSVRIEAPIPGKSVIGLEVPNADRDLIRFREAASSPAFTRGRARLPLILGKSVDGEMVVADLAKMPHLLIAGSTGSGKSVAVNTLIASLLYKFLPTDLRLLMIDPKMVELTPFDGDPAPAPAGRDRARRGVGVLLGAVAHMERRYKMMRRIGQESRPVQREGAKPRPGRTCRSRIVIDELADLMITSPRRSRRRSCASRRWPARPGCT